MKRVSVATVVACCALAFALVGCSGGGSKSTDAESLKGFWEIDPASQMGFEATLNLEDDDFAELVIADSYLEGTWKADGSKATIEFESDDFDFALDEEEDVVEEEGSDASASKDAADKEAEDTSAPTPEVKVANIYVSNGNLVLGQDDGSKIVFIKSDIDEYYGEDEAVELEEAGDLGEGTELIQDGAEVVEEVIEDISPVSIADDKVCKIEVTGKGTDFTADPGYRLAITNKSDKTVFIVADGMFKINGQEIEPGLGELAEPGESIDSFLYFPANDLGGGAEKLQKVEGTIIVCDDETSDELGRYTFNMD